MTMIGVVALTACLAVTPQSDKITAADLAPAFPNAVAQDPAAVLGFAPAPGAQRVFRGEELRRLAALFGVANPQTDVCIERKTAPPDPQRMLDAMRAVLPAADVELLDYSRQPAPEGEMGFPVAGLRQEPGGAIWRGWIRYGGNQRFAIWAKVKAQVTASRVVATERLKPGAIVQASQLRLEEKPVFAAETGFAASLEEVAGRVVRRAVAEGEALRTGWIESAKDVRRGDSVQLISSVGSARVETTALAEGGGVAGDMIPVVNPESKRRIMARIEGKGRVSVGKGNL